MDFSEIEQANEAVVNNFCRDWSLRDIDALMPYLAEDLVYQITPGQPLITSAEQFRQQMGPFLTRLAEVEWEIIRSHAVGPLVLNERIDHFIAPAGGKTVCQIEHGALGAAVVQTGQKDCYFGRKWLHDDCVSDTR